LIEGCELNASDSLNKYDIPRSTYYRWKRNMKARRSNGLEDDKPYRDGIWNQLLNWLGDKRYEYARLMEKGITGRLKSIYC
jgi:ACT domain-containing protein